MFADSLGGRCRQPRKERRENRLGRKNQRRMGGLFNRGKKAVNQNRVIGIIGAGRGTGVTHLALWMANYLASSLQRRTAFIEWNGHGSLGGIEEILSRTYGRDVESPDTRYTFFGVTYYKNGNSHVLAACMDGNYDEIIIDFGEMRPSVRAEWLRCTVKMVAGALNEWKLGAFLELLAEEENRRRGWIYTAAFGSEDTRREIEKRFRISLFRVPLSVDAFSVDRRAMEWFERIL